MNTLHHLVASQNVTVVLRRVSHPAPVLHRLEHPRCQHRSRLRVIEQQALFATGVSNIGCGVQQVCALTSVRHRGSAPAPRTVLLTEALAPVGVAYVAQGDPRLGLGAVNGLR